MAVCVVLKATERMGMGMGMGTHAHKHKHAHKHAHKHTHTHRHKHSYSNTHTDTNANTNTNTHTHTRQQGNVQMADVPLCKTCSKPILTRYVEFEGNTYHRGCFVYVCCPGLVITAAALLWPLPCSHPPLCLCSCLCCVHAPRPSSVYAGVRAAGPTWPTSASSAQRRDSCARNAGHRFNTWREREREREGGREG